MSDVSFLCRFFDSDITDKCILDFEKSSSLYIASLPLPPSPTPCLPPEFVTQTHKQNWKVSGGNNSYTLRRCIMIISVLFFFKMLLESHHLDIIIHSLNNTNVLTLCTSFMHKKSKILSSDNLHTLIYPCCINYENCFLNSQIFV